MNLSEFKGVLVFTEQRTGELQKVSLELIGEARRLADELGQEVIAGLVGKDVAGLTGELISHGADKVYVVDSPVAELYMTEPYTKSIVAIIEEVKPAIVLFGATSIGRDLAPRVAARWHTGLVADCTSLAIEEGTGNLLSTRPAFGGNIMATIACPDFRPQMSTVRPGVMQKLDADPSRKGEVINFDAKLTEADKTVEIIEEVRETTKRVNIEEADVLVSAGRGVGGPDKFGPLEDLAAVLKGTVSGSRATIDSGWLPKERQVGQTGKTVRPQLYMACGISGAIQHLAGMEESDFIVAVNKNPEAPIFEVADIGVVGDLHKVLPLVTEEIKKAQLAEANK